MAYFSETPGIGRWLSRLVLVLPTFERRRPSGRLDPRRLSDHLKRDMGFLDGLPTDKRA